MSEYSIEAPLGSRLKSIAGFKQSAIRRPFGLRLLLKPHGITQNFPGRGEASCALWIRKPSVRYQKNCSRGGRH